MKSTNKLMILIILECRLSLKAASELFKISEEEIKERFNNEPFAQSYKEGLDYLFNYETVLNNERRDKKTLFLAKYYINLEKKILKNQKKAEKIKEYNKLLNKLMDKDILTFIKNNDEMIRFSKWTEERKIAILKYKLKRGLDARTLEYNRIVTEDTIIKWTANLEEGDFKERLIALDQYHASKYSKKKLNLYTK